MMNLSRQSLVLGGVAVVLLVATIIYYAFGHGTQPAAATIDPTHPQEAARALLDSASTGDVERIAPFVQNPDTTVAVAATTSLGQIHTAQSVSALTAAANDSRPEVQAAALNALGAIPTSIPVDRTLALSALNDPDRPVLVRAAALQMIGARKIYHSLPDLIPPLNDKDPLIRAKAYATIKAIFCKDYGYRANDPEPRRLEMIRRIKSDIDQIDWNTPNLPE